MPDLFGRFGRWMIAVTLLLGVCSPAASITRTSIAVDGDVADWAVVLIDPDNYVSDRSKAEGDPDDPNSADRDIRLHAITWDDNNVYLYFRRTDSGNNSVDYLAYVDLNDDQMLDGSDTVLHLKFNGTQLKDADAYAYAPVGVSDAITPDGVDEPGQLGALLTTDLTARAVDNGIEFEAQISWSSLGLAPGSPLNIHFAAAQGLSLPNQVEDNVGLLSTRFRGLRLLADRTANTSSPSSVDYSHTVRNTGNQDETANLIANSSSGFQVTIFSDPDDDGIPDVQMALDLNGNGVYTDVGDVLDPAFDSDFDDRPDTGIVGLGGQFSVVIRVDVPIGVPNGSEDVLLVTAISANDSRIFRTNEDLTVIGDMVITPDNQKRAVEGTDIWYSHDVCNLSGATDLVTLNAASSRGWPAVVWSDPNGDGNPNDGMPIGDTGPLPTGDCYHVVLVLTIPPVEPLGVVDVATVSGALGSDPTVVESALDTTTISERLTFTVDLSDVATPGSSVFYPALAINSWFETAVLDLTFSTTLGVEVVYWSDPNGDGDPSDGRPIQIIEPVEPNGGERHIVIEVIIPTSAQQDDVDVTVSTVTLRADSTIRASVTDVTTVQVLATYAEVTFTRIARVFPRCVEVYARINNLNTNKTYRFEWYDSFGIPRRLSTASRPDAAGQLSDSLAVAITDPVGVWTVRVMLRNGTLWDLVEPGGSTEFIVTDDLGSSGGIIASLLTDKLNYSLTGDSMSIRTELQNPSPITYPSTFIDYVIFRDADGDGMPTAGEDYIMLTGNSGSWSPGITSCRTSGLPDIRPFDQYLDTACGVAGMSFTTTGVWHMCGRWRTQCGSTVALECVQFNVGCSPADLPAADAGSDRDVCIGDATVLGTPGLPGLDYDWSPAVYLDDPAIEQPTSTPDVTITYSLTVTNPVTQCVNTSPVTVTVNPLPTPDPGVNATSCGQVPVMIGVDPGPGFTCTWSPTNDLSDPNLCTTLASPAMTTVYEVSWTDVSTGCVGTDVVTVRGFDLPVIDAGPDTFVCSTFPSVQIGVNAPGFVFSWSPTTDLSDPNSPTPTASPSVTTVYTVTGTDTFTGCENTDSVTVQFADPVADAGGPGPVQAPINIGVMPCDPTLDYIWTPAAGLDDPTVCAPVAAPSVDTTYCLVVRDKTSGCESAPDCIDVTGAPICQGADIPGAIADVKAVKDLTRLDVVLEWAQETKSNAGYRAYAVTVKSEIPDANTTAPTMRVAFTTTPSVTDTTGSDVGGVPGSGGDVNYYQVVGICSDGITEGPID